MPSLTSMRRGQSSLWSTPPSGRRARSGRPSLSRSDPVEGAMGSNREERLVRIATGRVLLEGNLSLPEGARGIVLFAHGSGSSRFSPRNRYVAQLLNQARLATLLVDLLSPEEEAVDLRTAQLRFNIGLLADRLVEESPIGSFSSRTRDRF